MAETEGPNPLQLALEKAQKIEAEIQKGEISEKSQPIIDKFQKKYQFEQEYPPQKAGVLGAKETMTDKEKEDIQQYKQQKEEIEQFLKDNLGNFGGFLYTTWKNKNHPESEDISSYGDKAVDTVKNPSMIGK